MTTTWAGRRIKLAVVVVMLVVVLESLGFRIVGSLVDLISMSVWTVVATLLLVGFVGGRLLQRLVLSRDMQRDGRGA